MHLAWVGLGWPGLAWVGLGWPGLAWAGLAWTGLGWPGLAWVGLGWPGLAWASIKVGIYYFVGYLCECGVCGISALQYLYYKYCICYCGSLFFFTVVTPMANEHRQCSPQPTKHKPIGTKSRCIVPTALCIQTQHLNAKGTNFTSKKKDLPRFSHR